MPWEGGCLGRQLGDEEGWTAEEEDLAISSLRFILVGVVLTWLWCVSASHRLGILAAWLSLGEEADSPPVSRLAKVENTKLAVRRCGTIITEH